ncbi:hypothetical protein Tco_0298533 [Tanacetum coccineum]
MFSDDRMSLLPSGHRRLRSISRYVCCVWCAGGLGLMCIHMFTSDGSDEVPYRLAVIYETLLSEHPSFSRAYNPVCTLHGVELFDNSVDPSHGLRVLSLEMPHAGIYLSIPYPGLAVELSPNSYGSLAWNKCNLLRGDYDGGSGGKCAGGAVHLARRSPAELEGGLIVECSTLLSCLRMVGVVSVGFSGPGYCNLATVGILAM